MNRREFQFAEGSSNKFWSIELREQSFIVHYGRVGTNGQSQEKTFTTADAANKEYAKLISEKTKKGYIEVQVGEVTKSRPMPVVKHVDEEKEKKQKVTMEEPKSAAQGLSENPKQTPSLPIGSLTLERRVRLSQSERNRVSWLWQPLERPKPRSFDPEACVRAAKKWHSSYGYIYTYGVEPPDNLTQEEAWFWIMALDASMDKKTTNWYGGYSTRQVKLIEDWERILRQTLTVAIPEKPAENALFQQVLAFVGMRQQWLQVLIPFFPASQLAGLIYDSQLEWVRTNGSNHQRTHEYSISDAFAAQVLSYESSQVREEVRANMAAHFHAAEDPKSMEAQLALAFLGVIRGGAELDAFMTCQSYPAASGLSLAALAGLPSEQDFVAASSRLGLTIPVPNGYASERVRGVALLWLAATEWRHLDMVVKPIVAATSKDECAQLARTLALVEAPEAAPAMLEVLLNSKAPAVAAEWFAQHPLHMAVGLAPVAMGNGKVAEAARDHLHRLRRNGQQDILSAAQPHLAETEREWLHREIIDHREELLEDLSREEMPPGLAEALMSLKPIKASTWLQSASLPPIKIAGKKLALTDLERVLSALKDTSLEDGTSSSALAALLKQHADTPSLDSFAWKLFEQWLGMGAASKDKWALGAVGHIGGDASVLKLTPLVRDWPGESQHQRAVFGLEVLRAVGTDTALMSLNGIAQKLKFQGLKEKAKLMMEGIAQARGFTREQLADRIVPDCGLDEQGGRVFDFGPRQFKFVLGPEMKPLVRDAAGKVKPDLPSPNSSDDTEKVEAAVAAWKLLKKTLKEVLKIQAERLEDAMITGRRWTPEEFEMLIIKHPLMVNLARQFVFGSYSETGTLTHSYRITEDQSLADSNDDPCELPGAGSIGVVHPAHLDEAAKSAWGQVLSDYEIIPPFQQLGREICYPEPGDLDLTDIIRFKGPHMPGITVYGILERSHWLKDTPADGGGFMQHSKYFPSSNITAFIQYTGMSIGYYEEPQEIESVYFVPGHVKPDWWGDHKNKLQIRSVDAVVISEVLRLVHAIVAKAV
jgi:predicted DNA-binding WGR domain protein